MMSAPKSVNQSNDRDRSSTIEERSIRRSSSEDFRPVMAAAVQPYIIAIRLNGRQDRRLAFVRGRPVHGGKRDVVQAQVYRKLSAVMDGVVQNDTSKRRDAR